MSKKFDIGSTLFGKLQAALIKASVPIVRDYEEIQYLGQIDPAKKERFADVSISKSTSILLDKLSESLPGSDFMINDDVSLKDSPFVAIELLSGKQNFLRGMGDFAICVAIMQDGLKEFEIIYTPIHQVTYWATKGEGGYFSDPFMRKRRLLVSKSSLMDRSVIGVDANLKDLPHSADIRNIGCPPIALCYVAAGNWDAAVIEKHSINPMGSLVVQEAGGELYHRSTVTVASNGLVLNFPETTGSE